MTSELIGLIPLGDDLGYSLDLLKESIESRFPHFRIETTSPFPNVDEAYYPERKQYHSTRILAMLEKQAECLLFAKVLGVADFDLFVPGMNFVFGEARFPGRVGVISTHRLKPQSPTEILLFHDRVTKEAVHEIGHMLGCGHCNHPKCVMYFSEEISDTDRKLARFCENCEAWLRA